MADDWQPGDLALCVNAGELRCRCGFKHSNQFAPVRRGQTGSVTAVEVSERLSTWDGCACVVLQIDGAAWGLAQRFRKIRPHEADAEDAETIRLLTGKPVRERVS